MRLFKVRYKDKEMQVIIPGTGDRSYDDYLEQAEREKTLEQLKNQPDKPKPKHSKEEVGEALRDLVEFRNRKRRGDIKKYY